MSVTQERLKEVLEYDPESGHFTWLIDTGKVYPGKKAGRLNKGYIGIQIDHVKYPAHRLAFLYMTGKMPEELVDHINENKSDNRFSNLRLASRAQNNTYRGKQKSNSSGYKGVTWSKKTRKWISRITHNGKLYQLGSYDTPEAAYQAYLNRAQVIHGEFFHP